MTEVTKILIVDDVPENLGVLFDVLAGQGYRTLIAEDGQEALKIARSGQPDLILLDIMMAGMDGFEVCARLKENPETRDIPVIFMTALSETADKLKGFEVGGVDYITKPFHQEEVLARVKTQLTIHRLQRELAEKNNSLEERNAQLDAFAHTVAHDLKNPLNGIYNMVLLTTEKYRDGFESEDLENMQLVCENAMKATEIIESLLLLAGTSKNSRLSLEPLDMGKLVENVEKRLRDMLKTYQGKIIQPETWPAAIGYPAWVEEVWMNYLSNALKYGGRPPRLELGYSPEQEKIRFWVRDNGPGLQPQEQARLFTPFTRLHTDRASGHGLGLTIVQNIIARLGGGVGVESAPGQGSYFYFTLPTAGEPG